MYPNFSESLISRFFTNRENREIKASRKLVRIRYAAVNNTGDCYTSQLKYVLGGITIAIGITTAIVIPPNSNTSSD